ncbi:MAG: hypothetical protein APF76_06540 [Desulfitibacter sp. BRH_c19]|nr:MAG: hypothetical protein APF76_06540 [Desulfitibacter sp. BRH_c19]
MENLMVILVMYSTYIILGALISFMPYLTRRTESFGVSIPEDIYYSKELRDMRKIYSKQAFLVFIPLTVIFSILSSNAPNPDQATYVFMSGIAILLGALFALYLKYYFQMKNLKSERNWVQDKPQAVVVDTSFRNKKIAYSNLWFIIPTFIMFITLIMTIIFFEQIPNRIPIHYGFNWEPTNMIEKSNKTVLWVPVQQIFMIGLFVFINSMISRAKQQINAANPEKSLIQNQSFRRKWSGFIIFTGTIMVLIFAFVQLSLIFDIDPKTLTFLNLSFTGCIVLYAIVLSVFTGQGGSRIKVASGKDAKEIDRDDDIYWKLGQFYFNPNDPTIFIEKRFGIGWTLNFGNIRGWLIIIVTILLIMGLRYLFSF